MLKYIVTLSGAILLSGCVTSKATQQETRQYRQESIQAVKSSEDHLSSKMDSVQVSVDDQHKQIEKLEKQLIVMSKRIDNLAKHSARALLEYTAKPKKEEVVIKPKQQPLSDHLIILGSLETVHLEDANQSFEARIDTGAATSSLNATEQHEFERNGDKWVKFNISNSDVENEQQIWVEAPLIRYAKVRQSNTNKSHRRPVVELWISLGDIKQKAQFTLADRSHMTNPVLLGREFIKDIALVDVSKEFIQTKKQ
ncbi:ATP-dependent Zn protease [Vibrio sp. UCD-FRSSP16_10]|uniref:ATP-dependent zinc protease family protein n=1 Tax=unclassified Vibrio TaxID=2614977 RepID=UPI0007FD6288|nr:MULTISPECIES: ATP-dependent zinc protease [unclassified Vibrio]OBT13900.1 ATP-dependent Zn protease [Vibrio sp. UCD-FRSSP16_30]OBT22781.1 ATP-dependent Zn protease [Vibrio sp. UCD-FRSSP16_10]